jgi:hypothetical protein
MVVGIILTIAAIAGIAVGIVFAVRGAKDSGANTIRIVAQDEDAQALGEASVTATRSTIGGADASGSSGSAAGAPASIGRGAPKAKSGASLTQASGVTNGRGIWQKSGLAIGDWRVQVS